MQLRKLQELFVESVRSQTESAELLELIEASGTLTNQEAIQVYSSDYSARMQEALGQNYEATWLVLGDDEFLALAEKYVMNYPSDLTNLTTYGEYFSELLAANAVDEDVIQLAIFEREFWKYFHSPDVSPVEISSRTLELASFDLSAIRFFKSELRLDLIWKNRELGSEAFEEIEVYETCQLALYKAEEKVEIKRLSTDAHKILVELKEVGRILDISPGDYAASVWSEVLGVLRFSRQ
jgi:hypothetical protein